MKNTETVRRTFILGVLVVTTVITACSGGDPIGLDTGLTGTVVRGPAQPVCHQNDPCDDEPFAASFRVERREAVVARFETGDDGRFSVPLAPGRYVVVPEAGAPILFPEQQATPVTVGSEGITEIVLSFDTGIR